MEIMTVKEKNKTRKIGATYNRSHKKEKSINKITKLSDVVVIPDERESFEDVNTPKYTGRKTFDDSTIKSNSYDEEQALKELLLNFQRLSAGDIITLEASLKELDFKKRPELLIKINFSSESGIVNHGYLQKYFKIFTSSGILELINSSVNEIFKSNPGHNSDILYVTSFIRYKNVFGDVLLRHEFNRMDFSRFSKAVCKYVYDNHQGQLEQILEQFAHSLFYECAVNTSTMSRLQVASLVNSIKIAISNIFNTKYNIKSLVEKISDIQNEIEDYNPPRIKNVLSTKETSYKKLFGIEERYPKHKR